jgi:phosphatidylserine/phosphatidylglycerophosphate/cardiolipin synthase-like enzyme
VAAKWKITSHEVYATRKFYSRFISSFSEGVERVVICSPYFDKLPKPFNNIITFCRFLQQREVEKIVIITRPPGCDMTAMPRETARLLDAQGIEMIIRATPYLHAKMYHLDFKRGYFRSFIGSANFTLGGLERNQEIVTEVEGVGPLSPCQREIERMLSDNGAMTFPIWVHRHQPAGPEMTT